jgi:hypothetical protein
VEKKITIAVVHRRGTIAVCNVVGDEIAVAVADADDKPTTNRAAAIASFTFMFLPFLKCP